ITSASYQSTPTEKSNTPNCREGRNPRSFPPAYPRAATAPSCMHAPLTVKVMNEAASSSHARRLEGRGASVLTSDTSCLHSLDASLLDDVFVELDFFGQPHPRFPRAFRAHLEAGLIKPLLHFRRAQHRE